MRAICRQLWRVGGDILRSRENAKIDWRVAPDTSSGPNVRNFRVLTWTRYSEVLRPAFDGDEEGSRFGGERSGGSPPCRRRLTYQPVDQVAVRSGRWSRPRLKTIRAGMALWATRTMIVA